MISGIFVGWLVALGGWLLHVAGLSLASSPIVHAVCAAHRRAGPAGAWCEP